MRRLPVVTAKAPAAVGPYSQAIHAGSFVFVSGQIPLDAKGQMVAGGVAEQTNQCLINIREILLSAGLTMEHVMKVSVFMTDLGQFAAMNEVYAKHFVAPYPARAAVQVTALPKGALIEIEAVALKP
jgi:2-iminobutanoate/2-iminopropanoate deaminase